LPAIEFQAVALVAGIPPGAASPLRVRPCDNSRTGSLSEAFAGAESQYKISSAFQAFSPRHRVLLIETPRISLVTIEHLLDPLAKKKIPGLVLKTKLCSKLNTFKKWFRVIVNSFGSNP
jgi:hypothetical protein